MVISGYLMSRIFTGRPIDIRKFYLNRSLRIYPLFVLDVSLGYFSTPDPRPTATGLDYLLALLPISNLYRLNYGAFGGQMWTIAVELQFYLLFPFLLTFRRTSNAVSFYGSIIGLAIAARAAIYLTSGTTHQFTFFTLFGNIDLFVAGMLAAEIYRSLDEQGRNFSIVWSIASLAITTLVIILAFLHSSFFHVDTNGVSKDGVSRSALWIIWPTILAMCWSGTLILYLRSSGSIPWSSALAALGTWSYSTYVWHILVIVITKHQLLWMSSYVFGLFVVLPITAGVSFVSYRLIERPFLELRKSYRVKDDIDLTAAEVLTLRGKVQSHA
jgi:peptidoglycan/LPS O-acetylase OafA/YrhL